MMEVDIGSRQEASVWRNPVVWLQQRKLSREFWVFFAASLCFSFGMSIYVFIFNLYLLDLHFNERAIGLVGGAMLLGSVMGILPAGLLTSRIGLRPMLIVSYSTGPALCAARVLVMVEPAQIGLGFFAGLAMCLSGVCFLPVLARLTTEENRPSAFSLISSAGVSVAIVGGVVCGYLQQWLNKAGFEMQPVEVKRLILVVVCGIAALGLFPILRLRLPLPRASTQIENTHRKRNWRRLMRMDPFLLRYLPAMALWTVVLTSFTPFANVYLSYNLHVPMLQIGLIFSAAQLVQVCLMLLTPALFRALGLVNGIVVTQLLTAVALGSLAATQNTQLAVVLYLGFFGMQWMSSPGLYALLMNKVPEEEHSAAASMTLFCDALVGAGSTAGAGILFTKFGYPHVLAGIAALAVVAAMLFRLFIGRPDRCVSMQP
jgi:predicted MFS family arabinose efflux permease